jgi:hypothetical protein
VVTNTIIIIIIIIIIIMLTTTAIPDDPNVNTEYVVKLREYKALEIEVSRMWKVRTKIVPVIIGASETIKKGSVQNVRLLSGLLSAIELQKVTMSTAHVIRKVLR